MDIAKYSYPKSSQWFISDLLCEFMLSQYLGRNSCKTRYPLIQYENQTKQILKELLQRKDSLFTTTPNLVCVSFNTFTDHLNFFQKFKKSNVLNNILSFTSYSGKNSGIYLSNIDLEKNIIMYLERSFTKQIDWKSILMLAKEKTNNIDLLHGLLKQIQAGSEKFLQEEIVLELNQLYEEDAVTELITLVMTQKENELNTFFSSKTLEVEGFTKALYAINRISLSCLFQDNLRLIQYYEQLYRFNSRNLQKANLSRLSIMTRVLIRKIRSKSNPTFSYCKDSFLTDIF